ncbi:MAG: FHA domain-containing protein [Planctomycetota bacterium]
MSALLTVHGGRIELARNQCYTLGRDPTSDFVVQDLASSRQHARLTVGNVHNAVFIEDLGSRNGTFVNGSQITERTPLEDASRIRIGASVYLLNHADTDAEEPVLIDTGTIGIEQLSMGTDVNQQILQVVRNKGRAASDFAGQLGAFSVLEVLQLLMQTNRSGTLNVAVPAGHAEIEVRRGEVLSASFQELEAFPALLMVVRQDQGIFWLTENKDECRDSIRQPANALLFELCRQMDEL